MHYGHSGCGGATSDSKTMCDMLAAYADHPNVIGITVFSLGCEKAQRKMFKSHLLLETPILISLHFTSASKNGIAKRNDANRFEANL